jgi:hypothetical protein
MEEPAKLLSGVVGNAGSTATCPGVLRGTASARFRWLPIWLRWLSVMDKLSSIVSSLSGLLPRFCTARSLTAQRCIDSPDCVTSSGFCTTSQLLKQGHARSGAVVAIGLRTVQVTLQAGCKCACPTSAGWRSNQFRPCIASEGYERSVNPLRIGGHLGPRAQPTTDGCGLSHDTAVRWKLPSASFFGTAFATRSAPRYDICAPSHVCKLFAHSTKAFRIQSVHEHPQKPGTRCCSVVKSPDRLPHPALLHSRKVPDTTGANGSSTTSASAS